MNNFLTPSNCLKGLTIALKINIFSFVTAVLLGVGWTYQLENFWYWDYFTYLCIFYGINIFFTLLIKKGYTFYLRRKETALF